MTRTLSERIVEFVGTGEDPTELVNLSTQSTVLGSLTADAAELNVLDGATAANSGTSKAMITGTSGALTIAGTATVAGVVQPIVEVADATPYTVLLANSGKLHKILEQTANITLNLPAVTTAGQTFKFEMGGVAAEAQNWIFTAVAGQFLKGGVTFVDNDAGPAADEVHAGLYGNGSSHVTLTIVTPAAGTWVEFVSNGTLWYVNGFVNSATVPAFS